MKHNFYVLCGIPGSGKSTWLEKNAHGFAISRDAIRFKYITNAEDYFSKEPMVLKEFYADIKKYLDANESDVYADATHLSLKGRNELFKALGTSIANHNVIALAFVANPRICIERSYKRTGLSIVPAPVIMRMFKSYVMPNPDKETNFNEVRVINT